MRENLKQFILHNRIIAIVRGYSEDVCLRLAEACLKGGIKLFETPFNQSNPESWSTTAATIMALVDHFGSDLRVGAGTVLGREELTLCQDAGGEFMVAPHTDPSLIAECVKRGLVAIPGAMTPSEAVAAHAAGADLVKLFPAGNLGAKYVKAIRAPLSHIKFLAVGGISADNIADFMKAGCVGAGVGGDLTNGEWIAAGEWNKITDTAKQLIERSKI